MLISAAVGGTAAAATASSAACAQADTGTSTTVALGNVQGNVLLNLSLGTTFTATIVGNSTFTFTNWPTTAGEVADLTVITTQAVPEAALATAPNGFAISFNGVTWLPAGAPPLFLTGPTQTNINYFLSPDNGTTVFGQGSAPISDNGSGIFGAGGDRQVVLNTSNFSTYSSFLGTNSSTSNPTFWLLRDVYLTSLTIDAGVTLQLGGGGTPTFRLFCTGTVNIQPGANVVTNVSGPTIPLGSLRPGASAPSGTNGTGGTGTGVLGAGPGYPGQMNIGAAGHGGASGSTQGGAGGTSSMPTGYSLPQALPWATNLSATATLGTGGIATAFPGGASGGAGAGDGTKTGIGGAGGIGGNPLFIAAFNLVNNGTIQANGGHGGAGAAGNAGGGGGGQGGPIMLIYSTYSGTGVLQSAGGSGGPGVGSGKAGTAGGASWIVGLVN